MLNIRILVFLFGSVVFTLSCTSSKDNPVVVVPEDVSFSSDVVPILSASCGGVGCHGGSGTSGVSTANYDELMSSIGTQYGSLAVIPSNASQSPLIDKLGSSPRFGSRMPLGGSPLTQTQISILRSWVENGAQEN